MENISQAGQGDLPLGSRTGLPSPENWPNPLSLSRSTDTRHSYDVMARGSLSLMTLVMAKPGLGPARRPTMGLLAALLPLFLSIVLPSLSQVPSFKPSQG